MERQRQHTCTPSPGSGVAIGAIDQSCRYDELCTQVAETMGAFNVCAARLVELTRLAIAEGLAEGPGLHSPAHWVAWRTGLATQTANSIVKLAQRADELPSTLAAFEAGELTLDQAAEIARHVDAEYEASALEFARAATVTQLRRTLPHFRHQQPDDPASPERESFTRTRTRGGNTRLIIDLHDDHAATLDAALSAVRDHLYQQRRAEVPNGERVPSPSDVEALCGLATSHLDRGHAEHPGSDRYLVNLHLEAGPDGPLLVDHLGLPITDHLRRMILCDCLLQVSRWEGLQPLDIGRQTRNISRALRRLLLRRDQGCTAPGCHRQRGLQVHHIEHWEDGGPTCPDNLLTLCEHHHRLHHQGLLGIARTAGVEPGASGWITFSDHHRRPLPPVGRATLAARPNVPDPAPSTARQTRPHHWNPHLPPLRPGTNARIAHDAATAIGLQPRRYECPSGERLRPAEVIPSAARPRPPT